MQLQCNGYKELFLTSNDLKNELRTQFWVRKMVLSAKNDFWIFLGNVSEMQPEFETVSYGGLSRRVLQLETWNLAWMCATYGSYTYIPIVLKILKTSEIIQFFRMLWIFKNISFFNSRLLKNRESHFIAPFILFHFAKELWNCLRTLALTQLSESHAVFVQKSRVVKSLFCICLKHFSIDFVFAWQTDVELM